MLTRYTVARSVSAWTIVLAWGARPFVGADRVVGGSTLAGLNRFTSNDTCPISSSNTPHSTPSKILRRRWSPNEWRSLVRLCEAGADNEQISRELADRSLSSIRAKLRRIAKGGDDVAISARESLERAGTKRRLSKSEWDQALRLREQGLSDEAVVRHLGLKIKPESLDRRVQPRSSGSAYSGDEDMRLRKCVEEGLRWDVIAEQFPGRTVPTLQQRWRYLRPAAEAASHSDQSAYPNAGQVWTTEEQLRLLQLYQEGKSFPTISRALQRPPDSISYKMYSMNIAKSRGGCSDMSVLEQQRQRLLNRGKGGLGRSHLSSEDLSRMKSMLHSGIRMNVIAYALGMNLSTVKGYSLHLKTGGKVIMGPWGDEETAKLQALVGDGATQRDVAAALGRSVKSIDTKVRLLRKQGLMS